MSDDLVTFENLLHFGFQVREWRNGDVSEYFIQVAPTVLLCVWAGDTPICAGRDFMVTLTFVDLGGIHYQCPSVTTMSQLAALYNLVCQSWN